MSPFVALPCRKSRRGSIFFASHEKETSAGSKDMNSAFQKAAVLLIALSFSFCSFVIAFVTGLENTPSSTRDTDGRTMGFNDRLSREHYAMALSNFRPQNLLRPESVYSLLLLGMHGWGAWLIFSRSKSNSRSVRRFFLAQGFLFPLGWIGIFILPWAIRSAIGGRLDREGFVDVPFIALTTHPIWIATAMVIAFALGRGFRQGTEAGFRYGPQMA